MMGHVKVRHGLMAAATSACMLALSWSDEAAAQTRSFACDNARPVTVTVTGPKTITAGPIEGRTLTLTQSRESPLYFLDGDYGVRIAPDQARIEVEIPDFGTVTCRYRPGAAAAPPSQAPSIGSQNPCGPGFRPVPETDRCVRVGTSAANERLPMWGKSLGGIVRNGPSMSARRITSLPEGTPVQIVESSGVDMGGYVWFRITVNGRPGFQWGGIMCSEDPLPGILERCRR